MTHSGGNLTPPSLSWISILSLLHLHVLYLEGIGLGKQEAEKEPHDSNFLTNKERRQLNAKR